jgi:hypothetical protein
VTPFVFTSLARSHDSTTAPHPGAFSSPSTMQPTYVTADLNQPPAREVVLSIRALLVSGGSIDRPGIVRRFTEGGIAEPMASRYADILIGCNADPLHHIRWNVQGRRGREVYRHPR